AVAGGTKEGLATRRYAMATFRYDRYAGPTIMGFSALLLGFAALCALVAGFNVMVLLVSLMSILFGTIGFWIRKYQITVEDEGGRCQPRFMAFNVRWEEGEVWFVRKLLNEDEVINLQIRGRWSYLQIHEQMVARPGFEAFLSAIRTHISGKERSVGMAREQ